VKKSLSPWPEYSIEEADAVKDVLLSNKVNYWTGEYCKEFEKEFASWIGTKYAIAISNGTTALDLSLRALDINGLGSISNMPEVIVTSRTFIASASSIINIGAKPVFVDIDRDSQNISVENIKSAITENTCAIICVHLAGWPCEMDKIMDVASANNLYVIEDCAQAHGAIYKGQMVGSFGDIAAWSFCQDKIMTTGGEGGMITTNDEKLWHHAWSYKDHGKSFHKVFNVNHPEGFRWLHDSFGINARMTEMQAIIGLIQLRKMPKWKALRSKNAQSILELCKKFPKSLRVPMPPNSIEHAWYKCYVFVKYEGIKDSWSRDLIIKEINKIGIPCFSGSCPEVYLEKAFEKTNFKPQDRLPVSKEIGDTSLMFLVHPSLTDEEIKQTCSAIDKVMNMAEK
jgi:dTDP-4-amino-4,6-dideoxygalactose transaminase